MPKILVVEDEKPLRENIITTLKYEGFEVIEAENGLIGLQLAYEQMPDLIVSDVMMPELSGYELLDELRQDLTTATIPFIFLTAKSETEDRRKGMTLGADDYLAKPFSQMDLLAAVRTQLEKRTTLETRQLRNFSQKLVAVHDTERRDLAEKLHSDVVQLLTSLKLTLEMGERLPNENLRQTLDDSQRLVETTLQTINDLVADLYPSTLDHLGLLPALFWQIERFTHRADIDVAFQHDGLNQNFSTQIKIAVYRILQEALDNVAFHADVDSVAVQIWVEDNRINLQISDEGVGFNVEQIALSEISSGLTEMNERVIALNGHLTVSSAPGNGTQLFARFPLDSTERLASGIHQTRIQSVNFQSVPVSVVSQEAISVVLGESNLAIQEELNRFLDAEPNINVVGAATATQDLLDTLQQSKPQLLILNITFTFPNNTELISQIVDEFSDLKILILSSYPDEAYAAEMLRIGTHGYILRDSVMSELSLAIQTIQTGQYYLSKTLSQSTIETFINRHNTSQSELDSYSTLTNREREILHLVIEGNTNAQIADQLVISPRTVETHRANMMRKLEVHNQSELMQFALRRGLLSPRD